MKTKTKKLSYEEVKTLPYKEHFPPKKPNRALSALIRALAKGDLKDTEFSYTMDIERAGKGPYLILMNHSSFIDLEMMSVMFKKEPYCIVCTSDGFVGKPGLMREIGCIATQKFVRDVNLISDISYALNELKTSVLMYPEASYSFDGTATPLPRKLGVLLKKLNVPVITVITDGAFLRDPLYNCLQKRKVKVSAKVSCLFTKEELRSKPVQELDRELDEVFKFDNFKRQQQRGIVVDEKFRADGLDRILYHCPHCHSEGKTKGKGTKLKCTACKAEYTLTDTGFLSAEKPAFTHIPDWYNYERQLVRTELMNGTYSLDCEVEIGVMRDYKAIYMIGSGKLHHDCNGFTLKSDCGQLNYSQSPLACYSLYSDYYWYEIGDMICIGTNDELYYCFPKSPIPVAKARLAAEELYKLKKQAKRAASAD